MRSSIQPGNIIIHSGETYDRLTGETKLFSERRVVLKRDSRRLYLVDEATGAHSTLNRSFVEQGSVTIVDGATPKPHESHLEVGMSVRVDIPKFGMVGAAVIIKVDAQMRTADIVFTSGPKEGVEVRRMAEVDLIAA